VQAISVPTLEVEDALLVLWCRSPGMAPRAIVWVAVAAVLLLGGAFLHRRHKEDTRALVDVVTRGAAEHRCNNESHDDFSTAHLPVVACRATLRESRLALTAAEGSALMIVAYHTLITILLDAGTVSRRTPLHMPVEQSTADKPQAPGPVYPPPEAAERFARFHAGCCLTSPAIHVLRLTVRCGSRSALRCPMPVMCGVQHG
jgi:hypothetical protein